MGSVILASMVASCGTAQAKKPGESTDLASTLLAEATKTAESVVAAVGLGVSTTKPDPPSPVPTVETPAARRPKPKATPVPAAPAAVAPAAVAAIPAAEPVPAPTVPVQEEEEAPPAPVFIDSTLYTAADTDVTPPTPPVSSGIRPWRIKAGPAVEVIVANDGTVEKVQVLGTTRWSDAAVLSHVKAWKFGPALRAGEPVRYRLLLDDPVVAP